MSPQENSNDSVMEQVKTLVPNKIVRNEIRDHFITRWKVISDKADGLQGKELEDFCTKIAPDFGGWVVRSLFALMWVLAIPAFYSGIIAQFALGGFIRALAATLVCIFGLLASVKIFLHFESQTWDYIHARSTKPDSSAANRAIYKLYKSGVLFRYFRHCVNREASKHEAA